MNTAEYLILYSHFSFSCQLRQLQLQQMSTHNINVMVLFMSVNVNDFMVLREVLFREVYLYRVLLSSVSKCLEAIIEL